MPRAATKTAMPRAATIIAIAACSTSYLPPEVGIVAGHSLRCDTKSKRSRALSRRTLTEGEQEYETSGEQDSVILASLASCSEMNFDLDALSKVKQIFENFDGLYHIDDTFCAQPGTQLAPASSCGPRSKGPAVKAPAPMLGALPDELLFAALQYTGVQGRSLSRAAQRCCDVPLRESLLLPNFPVSLTVKQHYRFGTQQPITTAWSLDVVSPSTPAVVKFCTEMDSEDEEDGAKTHESMRSGKQVLGVCHELRALQTKLGAHHREDGPTQVEIVATDAAGRTLLHHSYGRSLFSSESDALFELLAEVELPPSSAAASTPRDDDGVIPQGVASTSSCSRTRDRSVSRARPVSRAW